MSGNKFLLDTNAVGLYLDDKLFSANYIKPGVFICISIITQLEFLSNLELSTKNRSIFNEFIELIEIYPVTRENKELLKQVVAIKKKCKLKLPDAIIASTAIVNKATLLSADKTFSNIHNLKFQFIKA